MARQPAAVKWLGIAIRGHSELSFRISATAGLDRPSDPIGQAWCDATESRTIVWATGNLNGTLGGQCRQPPQVVPFERRSSEVNAICRWDSRSKSRDQHFIRSKGVRV